ncbi:DNA-damage-inducible/multi antimicrobial extrusion protein [Crocosphaera subtropica ATCC 51142]|uniref:Probable multidrug resistance protein NorM n=1 Tax=Crocosphaera subtropica (strain ATCC 51142 / BH68) TaxID=43989 RepID=B1WTB3_CROS5|nr:guanitoxin biosynthesis MATE family efflux transporter GntT [Crocosphaera subtropica]ACB52035.1 DNA-damage-inducible/multi antimicrobial extrusion protein [Crocosphaera subtropica ATCC 51142]
MNFSLPVEYRSFLPRFYRLASVSVLSNMMVPLAGLCDTAFLGHLEDIRYLAGVILGSILFDYLYRVLKFIRSGTNAITAQAVGRNDKEGILLAIFRSGLIALTIAFVILILQYPIEKIGFTLLSGSPNIEASGIDYFRARIWGAPAVLLNFVFIGWFLGREMKTAILLLSIVGNFSNVGLDYLMIYHWSWGSMGAGLATAISQYLALLVALIFMVFSVQWHGFSGIIKKTLEKEELKSIIALKSNILIRFLALISAYSIFTNLSALLGTEILAANGLLLQIALLSQFTIQGIGMTTQTLTGNFKGKGTIEQIMPLLVVSIINSLLIALSFAIIPFIFPETIFNLLTDHQEISKMAIQYTLWLLPLLCLTATAFMLEGYFIGLKEATTLRNGVLIAFFIGFLPLAIMSYFSLNNHLLWSALTAYMGTLMITLFLQLPKVQKNHVFQFQESE